MREKKKKKKEDLLGGSMVAGFANPDFKEITQKPHVTPISICLFKLVEKRPPFYLIC